MNGRRRGEMAAIFAEAIRLELAIADLYRLFSRMLPSEEAFWTAMAEAEEEHASWLESFDDFVASDLAASGHMRASSGELARGIAEVEARRRDAEAGGLDMRRALKIAVAVEMNLYERNYSRMISGATDAVAELLHRLSRETQEHIRALEARLTEDY